MSETQQNPSGRGPQQQSTYQEPDLVTQGLLNQSLRQQLQQLSKVETSLEARQRRLRTSFADLTRHIVLQTQVSYAERLTLHEQAYEQAMLSMQQARLLEETVTHQFIHESGLVLSPLNCSHTIKDVNRIGEFGLGLHQLICQQLSQRESIHILYPACGPFAPLLLPLLSAYLDEGTFSAEQIKVTLVDIHTGAAQTLRQLVQDLGLETMVTRIATQDACLFEPSDPVDILLLEASHHGFSKEAHFSIARQQLPFVRASGLMVPQTLTVHAALVKGQTEFVEQWHNRELNQQVKLGEEALRDRIELGEIWRLDRASIEAAQIVELADGQRVVACNRVAIPTDRDDLDQRILVLYTRLETFGDGLLDQYFSGITHPRPDMSVCIDFTPRSPMADDLLLKRGDSIQFYYRLTGLTGFMPIKAQVAEDGL